MKKKFRVGDIVSSISSLNNQQFKINSRKPNKRYKYIYTLELISIGDGYKIWNTHTMKVSFKQMNKHFIPNKKLNSKLYKKIN